MKPLYNDYKYTGDNICIVKATEDDSSATPLMEVQQLRKFNMLLHDAMDYK